MTVTDEMAGAVLNAFGNIVSETVDCGHCGGHGTLGDDYCDMCGGSGWAIVHSEQEAMKLALEMVFVSGNHAGEGPVPSTLAAQLTAGPSASLRGEPAPDRTQDLTPHQHSGDSQ